MAREVRKTAFTSLCPEQQCVQLLNSAGLRCELEFIDTVPIVKGTDEMFRHRLYDHVTHVDLVRSMRVEPRVSIKRVEVRALARPDDKLLHVLFAGDGPDVPFPWGGLPLIALRNVRIEIVIEAEKDCRNVECIFRNSLLSYEQRKRCILEPQQVAFGDNAAPFVAEHGSVRRLRLPDTKNRWWTCRLSEKKY